MCNFIFGLSQTPGSILAHPASKGRPLPRENLMYCQKRFKKGPSRKKQIRDHGPRMSSGFLPRARRSVSHSHLHFRCSKPSGSTSQLQPAERCIVTSNLKLHILATSKALILYVMHWDHFINFPERLKSTLQFWLWWSISTITRRTRVKFNNCFDLFLVVPQWHYLNQ